MNVYETSARRKLGKEAEELDEWACRAFNPDDHIQVVLPCGAVARVAPDLSPERLAALDRMAVTVAATMSKIDGAKTS